MSEPRPGEPEPEPRGLTERLRVLLGRHPEAKAALFNVNWIVFEKLVAALLGFAIGIWVARYLGPEWYGVISYVLAVVALLSPIALLGLNSVVVREIVTAPASTERVLGTAFLLKLGGAAVSAVLAVLLVDVLAEGESGARDYPLALFMIILGVGTVFRSFDVVVYFFQAQVKAKYFSLSNVLSNVCCSLARVTMVLVDASLLPFIFIFAANNVIITLSMIFSYRVLWGRSLLRWRFDFAMAKRLLKDSWPLALSLAAALIYLKIDQIMIGNMIGNRDLGIYSAAVRLTEVWNFVPLAIMESIFPAIIRLRTRDRATYLRRIQTVCDAFLWTTIGIGTLATFFSDDVVAILYGARFAGAGAVLTIYIWSAVFVFLNAATGYCLIAENFMMVGLFRTATGAAVNVGLNLAFIPRWGIVGSAYATLIAYAWTSTLSLFLFPKTRVYALMQLKSLNLVRVLLQARRLVG